MVLADEPVGADTGGACGSQAAARAARDFVERTATAAVQAAAAKYAIERDIAFERVGGGARAFLGGSEGHGTPPAWAAEIRLGPFLHPESSPTVADGVGCISCSGEAISLPYLAAAVAVAELAAQRALPTIVLYVPGAEEAKRVAAAVDGRDLAHG